MALIKGPLADEYIPIDWVNAGKFFPMTYTGGARHNQVGLTTAAFNAADVGANQNVTFDPRDRSRMTVGAKVQIGDGTDIINGTVLSVSGNVAVVRTDELVAGTTAADEIASGATITPITTAAVTLVAVGTSITIPMGPNAANFLIGDTVAFSDGTDSMTGVVTGRAGNSLILNTTVVSTAGNELGVGSLATSTSGDFICFGKLPPHVVLDDCFIIMSATNSSVTVSAGHVATDLSSVAGQASLVAAATALATATRIRANSTVTPVKVPVESYVGIRVGGASITAATILTMELMSHFPGNP